MSPSEDIRQVIAHRRAILRARDVELARSTELRATAAITVLQSKDAIRRAKELVVRLYEVRRQCEPLRRREFKSQQSGERAAASIPLQRG